MTVTEKCRYCGVAIRLTPFKGGQVLPASLRQHERRCRDATPEERLAYAKRRKGERHPHAWPR